MKNLHSFAFFALVSPVIALGSGALLAAQPAADSNAAQGQQGAQHDQGATKSTTGTFQTDKKMHDQSGTQSRSYMDHAPANAMQASKLIGTEVKTTDDDDVGSVSDLIIDQNGKVVAIIVGVGGFLAMGEKDVAISWDKVMKSGTGDKLELRIDQSRDALSSAPEYKKQD